MVLVANPISSKLTIDRQLNRTYVSEYQVPDVPLTASPLDVIQATGIPNYLSYYSWFGDTDLYAGFSDLDASPEEDISITTAGVKSRGRNWKVTITHSTESSGNTQNQNNPKGNPLLEPAIVTGSYLDRLINAVRDKDGNPIINTAKSPIDPIFQIESPMDSLNIQFNTASLSLSTRSNARGKVNSASMWGLGPRQIKMKAWNYSVKWLAGTAYVSNNLSFLINTDEVTYNFVNRPGSTEALVGFWNITPNRGYMELKSSVQRPILINDNKPDEPQILKENGEKATDNVETWLAFAIEKEFNFLSITGLPATLPGPFV